MILTYPLNRRWSYKGYDFGQCCVDDTNKLVYVNIPKNATNWMHNIVYSMDWRDSNVYNEDLSKYHALVILRNPIERWVSGVAEYIKLYHKNIEKLDDSMWQIISDIIAIDDHTDKQVYFVNTLSIENVTFFQCDENLSNSVQQFFQAMNIDIKKRHLDPYYVTDKNSQNYKIIEQIKQKISDDILVKRKLNKFFQEDIDLIKSVLFFNNNE